MADGGEGDERPERPWCGTYILDGHTPVPEYDSMKWGQWYGQADRHVASTHIGCLSLSTIFLGLDHSFGGERPVLFETMIFRSDPRRKGRYRHFQPLGQYPRRKAYPSNGFDYQARYCTWGEAVRGHRRVLGYVQKAAAHKIRFAKLDDPFEQWQEYKL